MKSSAPISWKERHQSTALARKASSSLVLLKCPSVIMPKHQQFPVTFETHSAHKQVANYLISKEISNDTTYPQPDRILDVSVNISSSIRNLMLAEDRLRKTRKLYPAKRRDLDMQHDALIRLKDYFRKVMISFSEFIRENMNKRDRAEGKCAEERVLIKQRLADIKLMQNNIDQLKITKKNLQISIRKFKFYEAFLSKVTELLDLKSISVIIERYRLLLEARDITLAMYEENVRAMDSSNNTFKKMLEDNRSHIVGLQVRLAGLWRRYGSCKRNALDWETTVINLTSQIKKIESERQDLGETCWDVYNLMCLRKGTMPTLSKPDFMPQLAVMKTTLAQLTKIVATASKPSRVKIVGQK